MSHEVAKTLYNASHEAGQKLEYFITGVIGAMFAYSVQNYTPHIIGWDARTLEPIAILCLAVSFFCGLKRIEAHYHHLGISYEKNQAIGDAKVMDEALRLIHADPLRHQPRQSIEDIQKSLEISVSRAKSATPILDRLDRQIGALYRARNWLMLAGFFLIVAAKIADPYSTTTKQPTQAPTPPVVSPTAPTSPPPPK